jgi:hypothetical protein
MDYWYSPMDFSDFTKPGFYKIQVSIMIKFTIHLILRSGNNS